MTTGALTVAKAVVLTGSRIPLLANALPTSKRKVRLGAGASITTR